MFTDNPKPKKLLGLFGPRSSAVFASAFKFFSSVKLAIPIIASLIVILAAGTIIESLYGTDAAKILVYDTPWFGFVLVLLGINVFAATLDRLPWKKKHIGFLVTHLGILLILAGSFVTRFLMIDGQMPIAEGTSEGYITLSDPLIYVYSEDLNADWIYEVPKKAFAWEGRMRLRPSEKAGHELYLLHFYPKARMTQWLEAAPDGPPAVHVRLKSSFVNQDFWLVEKDPDSGKMDLGPASIVFTDELLKENSEPVPQSGYLEFQFKDKPVSVTLPDSPAQLPFTVELEGTPYKVTITRMLSNAVVVNNELQDQPEPGSAAPGKNPAAELTLEGEGLTEYHTVFARFPDFPTQHGMKPSAAGVRIFYRVPGSGDLAGANELRFVRSPEGELLYQVKSGTSVKTGKAVPHSETPTGWMDFTFTVEEYLPHSAFNHSFVPQPNTSQATDLVSAAEVELRKGAESRRVWLAQGLRSQTSLSGAVFHLVYGEKRMPLGFKLELKDFKMENYPGTDQPARYSSDVVLKDETRGVSRDVHITMNEPLEYRGFKIYQSAYSLQPGQPEVSIFAVGKDPGVPLKYAGAIVLITGTITIFSQRKFRKRAAE